MQAHRGLFCCRSPRPYHLYRSVLGEIIAKTGLYIEVDIIHTLIVNITCLCAIFAIAGIVYQRILEGILFRLIRYDLRKNGVGAVAEVFERTAYIGQPSLCHKVDNETLGRTIGD